MRLDVNGTVTSEATNDDVARAVAARPSSGDWSIVLEDDGGDYLQGYAESGSTFRLTCREKAVQVDGKEPVTDRRLEAILVAYLNGDPAWRSALSWDRSPSRRDEPSRSTRGQALALMGLTAWAAFELPRWEPALSKLPFPFDRYIVQLSMLVAVVPIGLLMLVARAKVARVARAAAWRSTPGKIIEAAAIRQVRSDDRPRVRYRYTVDGRTFVGDRISFGDDGGRADAAAPRERYFVGQSVTVHFDPSAPADSVLERDAPKSLLVGLALVAFLVVMGTVVVVVATSAPAWIDAHLPTARNSQVATFAGLMGLGALLLSVALWRRYVRAAGWPVAPGVITASGIETKVGSIGTGGDRRRMTTYQANVEYSYTVDGQAFIGRRLTLDSSSSGSHDAAAAIVARYRVGAKVGVRYDPANPTDAALERSFTTVLIPFVLAIVLIAFALYQAGVY